MGETTIGYLRTIDRQVRHFIRQWLHLPSNCPNAYFHASVKDGGLGVRSCRWAAPLERVIRLRRLMESFGGSGRLSDNFLRDQISKSEFRLRTCKHNILSSKQAMEAWWASRLYLSIDGRALKDSRRVLGQHSWVADGTRFLSGRDFVNLIKLIIGAIPSRSRTARGQRKDRICHAGCNIPETSNHALQLCYRTHDVRIRGHDALVEYVVKKLRKSEFSVLVEPEYLTSSGTRKPNIIATLGRKCLVIDAQVVSEQTDLIPANELKVRKYKSDCNLIEVIKLSSDVPDLEVVVLSITLNWRGVWSVS